MSSPGADELTRQAAAGVRGAAWPTLLAGAVGASVLGLLGAAGLAPLLAAVAGQRLAEGVLVQWLTSLGGNALASWASDLSLWAAGRALIGANGRVTIEGQRALAEKLDGLLNGDTTASADLARWLAAIDAVPQSLKALEDEMRGQRELLQRQTRLLTALDADLGEQRANHEQLVAVLVQAADRIITANKERAEQTDALVREALGELRALRKTYPGVLLNFRDAQIGDVSLGDIAGGDVVKVQNQEGGIVNMGPVTLNQSALPPPLPPAPPPRRKLSPLQIGVIALVAVTGLAVFGYQVAVGRGPFSALLLRLQLAVLPPCTIARPDEQLIVVVPFFNASASSTRPELVVENDLANQIVQSGLANVRVEVAAVAPMRSSDRAGARMVGERCGASLVIWGEDLRAIFQANLLNLKLAEPPATITRQDEIVASAVSDPVAEFVARDLPQLTRVAVLFGLARVAIDQGNEAKAVALLEQATTAKIIEATEAATADALFLLGTLYSDQGQAIAVYEQALALNPALHTARYLAAAGRRKLEPNNVEVTEAALPEFTRVITEVELLLAEGRGANLLPLLGVAYYDRATARQEQPSAFRRQASDERRRGEGAAALASLDAALAMLRDAQADLARTRALLPDFALGYYNGATALQDAVGIMRERAALTCESDPGSASIAESGVEALALVRRALELLNGAIEREDSQSPFRLAYYNRGLAWRDLGDSEQARADFAVVASDPELRGLVEAEVVPERSTDVQALWSTCPITLGE